MREMNLEIVRVTEAAAISAAHWVGSGDKIRADQAATEAMKERLDQLAFHGKVMIGEGKKDKSFGLFFGDHVGAAKNSPKAPVYELAVDPIDGTRPTIEAGPEAMSVLTMAGNGALFTTEAHYMNKLAFGPFLKKHAKLSIKDPIEETVKKVSRALEKPPEKITICLLDRPRHEPLIQAVRKMNVRTKLIRDCDVSAAIATCLEESGIDLLCGAGGAPEGVLTACAMKCLGGGLQGQLCGNDGQVSDARVLDLEDLVKGHCVFAATGVTTGSLLKGVRFATRGPVTHSVFMRSESGTVRWLTTYHGHQKIA